METRLNFNRACVQDPGSKMLGARPRSNLDILDLGSWIRARLNSIDFSRDIWLGADASVRALCSVTWKGVFC